jgi:hypothetical protein
MQPWRERKTKNKNWLQVKFMHVQWKLGKSGMRMLAPKLCQFPQHTLGGFKVFIRRTHTHTYLMAKKYYHHVPALKHNGQKVVVKFSPDTKK